MQPIINTRSCIAAVRLPRARRGACRLVLAVLIAAMAALLALTMVLEPDTIRTSGVLLILLVALASACWAMGWRLRRDAVAEEAWDE